MKAKIKNSRTGISKVLNISDLSGGLNIKGSVYDIADNEAQGLVNFIFTETGILTVRSGYIKYNTVESLSSTGVHSLFRFYKKDGSTKYFVATSGTSIYSGSGGTWTGLTCNETLTTDLRFRFAVFNDDLFMTNGTDKPLAWSGTGNVRQIGIVAPTAGSSGTPTSGGACTDGEHNIRITYYNSTDDIESSHLTLTAQTCGTGNNTIPLSGLTASSDTQVDMIRIYMTEAGGSTYYYVDQQADTTSTYNISISDTNLASNAVYDATDFLPPPTDADYIALSHRRLFFLNNSDYPSRLYWSEIDQPEYFPAANYRDISPDDNDWGTGILAWNDYLYIFKQNGTYILTDPADPANSILREVSRDIGILAPDTLCTGQFQRPVSVNDWILVPGIIGYTRFGIQGFDGQQWHMLSERVEPILESINEQNKSAMVGFFNKSKYYLSYQPEKGDAVNSGFVFRNQITTDSGNDVKDATYSTDHDLNNYSSTYDARIDLTDTSTSYDKELKVKVWVDWAGMSSWYEDEEYIYNQNVYYEIFVSKDDAVTWTSKGVFKQAPSTKSDTILKADECQFYFFHTFIDTSVTDIRLDYFKDEYAYMPNANKIRLVSTEYFYDVSLTSVKNNRVLYYDSLHNAWSEWRNIHANSFCAFNGQDDEGEEYFGSSRKGFVYRMNIGSEDDGNDIFWLLHTKNYDCNQRFIKKRFQQLTINSDVYFNTINLDFFTDRIQRSYDKVNLLPTNIDTKYWNEEYFGNVVFDQIINLIQKTLRLPSNALGRFCSLKVWGTGKNPLAFQNFAVKYTERESFY